ncbi:EamA family transporter [Clostridium sp. chh4-2]|uniref:DMT family transporter n=1 Tax=Clostridium sp. chh4-2 TaxID=2067550 RepID=UPI000CCFB078|nr:DMT family transporter [Clostridium sp. chh4-2]PNV63607.1 EamA family transporter [Clostridium sp. chh4-2]
MESNKNVAGHIAAAFTIFIWGTTFISTKVLLRVFDPVEILFFRFLIGYFALWLAAPRFLKVKEKGQEIYFVAAGLCGVTLYFLMENFALTFTLAANVGVIISIAPFFTALFNWLIFKGEKPGIRFILGFIIAMAGIYLISFRGDHSVSLNPTGDFLSVGAAIVWAAYSILTKKISGFGYGTVQTTRRIFFYGILLMIPALFFFNFRLGLDRFMDMKNLLNILFLGFGASALCFVTWNFALKRLGSVKTSAYIYAVPVITVVTSVLILNEKVTAEAVCGIGLTLAGLVMSEGRFELRPKKNACRLDAAE